MFWGETEREKKKKKRREDKKKWEEKVTKIYKGYLQVEEMIRTSKQTKT